MNSSWSLWVGRPSTSLPGTPDRLIALPTAVVDDMVLRARVLECTTWGQVRALGDLIYNEVVDRSGYRPGGDMTWHFAIEGTAPGLWPSVADEAEAALRSEAEPPDDTEPFDVEAELHTGDGDWPPSAFFLMNGYLPAELIDRCGHREKTVLNGAFAWLNPERRAEVGDALSQDGSAIGDDPRLSDLLERETWGPPQSDDDIDPALAEALRRMSDRPFS